MGTGTTTIRSADGSLCPAASTAATYHCCPGNSGGGCSSWTASGVSAGSISLAKWAWRNCRCGAVQSRGSSTTSPRPASSASSLGDALGLLLDHAMDPALMAESCAAGVMPAGSRRRTPAARARIRPATRTRKNSSRLELTMARNFSRSKQRHVLAESLAEHAVVELQPAQFPIDEQLRRFELLLGHGFAST